jgi:hypothetical protein
MEKMMPKPRLNPFQIVLAKFAQTFIPSELAQKGKPYRYDVTLDLTEDLRTDFRVHTLSFQATGPGTETMTQNEALRRFLIIIEHAIARERAGIQPGTPTPEGLIVEAPKPQE